MTIDEAIKILDLMGTPVFRGHTEDILAARKLGIEALKREKAHRLGGMISTPYLIPGETEE